jgi:protease-4
VDSFGGLEDAIAQAATLARLDPAKARAYYIEPEPSKFAEFFNSVMSSDADARVGSKAALPTDLLGRQAWRQRQVALQAIGDARSMTQGAGIRASCLECGAYAVPGAVDITQRDGILWRMLTWVRG